MISEKNIEKGCAKTESLVLEHDQMVYLSSDNKISTCPLRLIKAKIAHSNEPIWFLSNMTDLSSAQIAAIYKKRWDIEVFFKFLKQELDLGHVLVRTENALLVNLYVKLIAAILLTAYQQLNQLKGYKIVKLRFKFELEEDLIKQVVLICGGDPTKMYKAP